MNNIIAFPKNKIKRTSQIDELIKEKADRYKISELSDDYLYFECRALSIGTPNANGDLFELDEVKKIHEASKQPIYKTFVGQGVYVNHNSDDPRNSIGLILDSELIESERDPHIRLLIAIDKKKDPEIVEGLKRGTINSVSMGCSIKYSECTYCGKKIYSDDDLCDCLKYHRGEKIGNIIVAERLKGIEFYEESIVNIPADYRARLIQIFADSNERRKVASAGADTLISLLTEKIYSGNYNKKLLLLNNLTLCEDNKECRLY